MLFLSVSLSSYLYSHAVFCSVYVLFSEIPND